MARPKFPPVDDLFVRANEILSAWHDDRADVLLDRDKCSPWLYLMYDGEHFGRRLRDTILTRDRLNWRPFDRAGTRTFAARATRLAGGSAPTTVSYQAPAPQACATVAHNSTCHFAPRHITESDVLEVVRSWEPDRFSSSAALVREDESGQHWAAVCVDAATNGDSSIAVLFLRAEEPGNGPLWRYHDVARLTNASQWMPGAIESEAAAVTSASDATAAANDAAYWDRAAAAAGDDAGSPAAERDHPARVDNQFEALDPVAEARSAVLQVLRDAIDRGVSPATIVDLLRDVADRLDRVTQML